MRRIWKLSLLALVIALPVGAVAIGWIGTNTTGVAPEGMRPELAQQIVERWSPYVQETYRTSPSEWAQRMHSTFEHADITNLERAASAENFQQMTSALLGASTLQQTGKLAPEALGTPGSDLVYTPVTPCRIIDTRVVGGAIPAGGTRMFHGFTATDFTDQGGDGTNCGIPLNASALTVKITASLPASTGHFVAYPSNEAKPLASSLNYQAGVNTSNESHFRLCRPACPTEFSVFALTQAHLVVDVNGYYMEPEATALDCTVAAESGNLALLPTLQQVDVSCPAGYTATGGGCGGVLGVTASQSEPLLDGGGQPVGWQCDLLGSIISILGYKVSAVCCRTPGF